MCGIGGIINKDQPIAASQTAALQKMMSALIHRGPDGGGFFSHKNVVFGHRRLSIVGLQDADQPLVESDDLGVYAITYNGELFNYRELKSELENSGYRFRTKGDTEVILAAYKQWGISCFDRMDAEFAFAIYDERKNIVILARDRTGVKPLFYWLDSAGNLIFASEPKSILTYGISREVNCKTVAEFFMGSCTFALGAVRPDSSFFKGIQAVSPGHYMIYKHGRLSDQCYWDFSFKSNLQSIGEEGLVFQMRHLLERSIQMRIPNEVKMGISLSGGLDSSIIAAVAAKTYSHLTAATISFQSGFDNEDYEHAKLFVKDNDINLVTPNLTAEKMMNNVDTLVLAMDEPHDSIAHLGMLANYKILHEQACKVVLIGEGADEMNLGYYYTHPGFVVDRELVDSATKIKNWYRQRANYVKQYFTADFLKRVDFDEMIDDDVDNFYSKCPSDEPLHRMQYYYAKKFLVFLEKVNDRTAMHYSLECRLPFLNYELIDFCLSVPAHLNLENGIEKMLLRKAFSKSLPQAICMRRKSRFPSGNERELNESLAAAIEQEVKIAKKSLWEILNKDFVLDLVCKYRHKIEEICSGANVSDLRCLTRHLMMSQQIEIRTAHLFKILTFMRWFELYCS